MAKLIGTAGHVDHGKTTLIRALTGIDADRLPEEKRRGMTIDIGFAFVDLPKSGRVSIVDVPGHERFLSNMLVGALGIDVALLCIAADDGVKPQTVEHLSFLDLLPVDRLVVALTRADLADSEWRELVRAEAQELVEKTRFGKCRMMFVSSVDGEGVAELLDVLDDELEKAPPRPKSPWRLPIDRAFTMKGFGAVVTGTLSGDEVHVGDEGSIEPIGAAVRIRGIQSHGESLATAEPGRRVALNLSGIKAEALERGQVVGRPGSVFATRIVDCRLRRVGEMKHGMRIRASIGAEEAIGKAFLSESDPAIVQLRFEEDVAASIGQPIIVRKYSPPSLLAGGEIVVPVATKRGLKGSIAMAATGGEGGIGVLSALSQAPNGLATEEVCRQLGRSAQDLGSEFESLSNSGTIVGFAGLWYEASHFEAASSRFLDVLARMHADQPMVGEHARESVAQRAGLNWSGKPFDRIVSRLVQDGKILANGTRIRGANFQIQLSAKQRLFLDRVVAVLVEGGINSPPTLEIAKAVHAPTQAVEEILRLGVESGELVNVGEGLVYLRQSLASLKEKMFETYGLDPFTAADFRDRFATSRKYAIPVLEFFDSQGFTVRVGDQRAIRRSPGR